MKKLFILAVLFAFSLTSFGQSDSTKSKTTGYAAVNVSLSNGDDFNTTAYPSIEGGIVRDNLTLGVVLGRGNFVDFLKKTDAIQNYYYEAKFTAGYPVGAVTGSVILGYGGYIDSKHRFIEYGVGMGYTVGKISYCASVTSWDGIVYLSPSIMLNF